MKRSYRKPQHEVFISGMPAHGDKLKAYKEAYPNISATAVRQVANRLLSYTHIRQHIEPRLQHAKLIAIQRLQQTAGDRMAEELDKLSGYLRSANLQGAPVRQQIETDWPSNPPGASIPFLARPKFVTKINSS